MKIYKVYDIDYCIEAEDIDLDEEDFETKDEYYSAFVKKKDEIIKDLPAELMFEIDEEEYDLDDLEFDLVVEDILVGMISDETGWLVNSFEYEKVDEKVDELEDDEHKECADELSEERNREILMAIITRLFKDR